MKLLFLDIDGVLNDSKTTAKCGPYRGIDFKKLIYLKRIVKKTDAKIALISSWKERFYLEAEKKAKQNLLANYLDKLFLPLNLEISFIVPDYDYFSRASNILTFIQKLENKLGEGKIAFIIIDDNDLGYRKNKKTKEHFIKTSFYRGGLKIKHVDKAIKMLNSI